MHLAMIGDVVAVVAQRRWVKWQEPDAGNPQILEIIEFLSRAGKVTDAVSVTVGKCAHVQFVEDRVLVPQRVRFHHFSPSPPPKKILYSSDACQNRAAEPILSVFYAGRFRGGEKERALPGAPAVARQAWDSASVG